MTDPTPTPTPRPGPPAARQPASGAEADAAREAQAAARVDSVLAELDELDRAPLAEHHDRLAAAHEKLHGLLDEHRQG